MNALIDNTCLVNAEIDHRLADERLRLAASQANASCVIVLLTMGGLVGTFHRHMDAMQISLVPIIALAYLLRAGIAHMTLAELQQQHGRRIWSRAFEIAAAGTGLLWGISAALWIIKGFSGAELFIAFLVGGIVGGAIPSLGFLNRVYPFYTLSIMLPVALAFVTRGNGLGPMLGILTLVYGVFLMFAANKFGQRLNQWLRFGFDNEELVRHLREERKISESRLIDLSHEVEERRKAEAEAEQHRSTLSNLLGNLPGMAYRATNDGRWSFEFISDGCRDILGLSATELASQNKTCIGDVLQTNDRRFTAENFRESGFKPTFEHEYNLITPLGDERRVIERGYKVFDETGKLLAIDGFVTDITDQFLLSNKLSQLEKYDSLTGIYNRQQFEVIVQNTVYTTTYDLKEHVLLYVDLDQFKIVNDTCGHPAGDELLCKIVSLFQGRLRQQDTIARWGGDEFGILLDNCSLDEGTRIAEELCETTREYRFSHEKRFVSLTSSIGVASTRSGLESLQQLMLAAEGAAFAAKEKGRNQVHVYQADDDVLARRNLDMHWAIEIPEAIKAGRMYLEWQKIVPVDPSASIEHWFEVLIRMRGPKGEPIMPGAFLPAAEQYHQAILIDTWVVKQVLSLLDQQPNSFDDIDLIFINLSGQTMGQPTFLENIYDLLNASRHSAKRLCFEITETAAMANKSQAMTMMARLQQLGCRFALDDFGSGLSSFGYLRDFPVDFIKIDGAFVRGMTDDQVNHSIVASICDIGHATGKKIIAEFVENETILRDLRDIGADYAQGYGIARPVPIGTPQIGISTNPVPET